MTLVVDTSALAAVVFGEPDAEALLGAMRRSAGDLHIGAVTLVEAAIVIEARQGARAVDDLHALLTGLHSQVVAVDEAQARLAHAAWRRFGKGRHPAALNLGDCFAYALAKSTGSALLFKGGDFAQTDIASAL